MKPTYTINPKLDLVLDPNSTVRRIGRIRFVFSVNPIPIEFSVRGFHSAGNSTLCYACRHHRKYKL